MKKRLAALALLACASTSTFAAGPSYVAADPSPLSRLCLAALESRAALLTLASELQVDAGIEQELRCNGLPVQTFVKRARRSNEQAARAQGLHAPLQAFRSGDESLETQLCLAALSSPLRFERLKQELGDADIEQELRCNDQPLEQFLRRYRAAALNASL